MMIIAGYYGVESNGEGKVPWTFTSYQRCHKNWAQQSLNIRCDREKGNLDEIN